jgi:type I restriction enzyme, R subunit
MSPRLSPREWLVEAASFLGFQQQAAVNDRATFRYAFDAKFMESVVDTMEHNTDLGKRLLYDAAFSDIVKEWMLARVHRRAAERHETPELDL